MLDVSLAKTLKKKFRESRDGIFASFDVFIPSILNEKVAMGGGRYKRMKTPTYSFGMRANVISRGIFKHIRGKPRLIGGEIL